MVACYKHRLPKLHTVLLAISIICPVLAHMAIKLVLVKYIFDWFPVFCFENQPLQLIAVARASITTKDKYIDAVRFFPNFVHDLILWHS